MGKDAVLLVVQPFAELLFERGDEHFGVRGGIELHHDTVDLGVGVLGFPILIGDVGDVGEGLHAEHAFAFPLIFEDADDLEFLVAEAHHLAESVLVSKEGFFGDGTKDDGVLGGGAGTKECAFGDLRLVHGEPLGGGGDGEGVGGLVAVFEASAGEGEGGGFANPRDGGEVLGVGFGEEALTAKVGVEVHPAEFDAGGNYDEDVDAEVFDLGGDVLLYAEADADQEEDGDAGNGDAHRAENGLSPVLAEAGEGCGQSHSLSLR